MAEVIQSWIREIDLRPAGKRGELMRETAVVRKAAVFLMSLGPEVAGRVMAKLPESMVEELTHTIASIGHVTFEEKKKVLSEFIA